MKFTVISILESLPDEGLIERKKLEKILKLTKKIERESLGHALIGLERLGLINDDGEGNLGRVEDHSFIQARLRCSSKGYCFVVREDQGEDIYIRESNLNNAWHGDSVIVLITKQGVKRRAPEGSIQCVLQRYNDTLLARIEQNKETNCCFPSLCYLFDKNRILFMSTENFHLLINFHSKLIFLTNLVHNQLKN